jgi:hypothetical protein
MLADKFSLFSMLSALYGVEKKEMIIYKFSRLVPWTCFKKNRVGFSNYSYIE